MMAGRTFILDCGSLPEPDLATVDALARLQLDLRRRGYDLRLRNAASGLLELIALVGLRGVLRVESRQRPKNATTPAVSRKQASSPSRPSRARGPAGPQARGRRRARRALRPAANRR